MAVPVFKISDNNEPIFCGDTWGGFNLTYREDGVAVSLIGASVRMVLVSDSGGKIDLTSSNGGFSMPNPVTGVIVCNKVNRMDYPAGTYNGDLEVTLGSGDRSTIILVQLFLKEDVTK